MPEILNLEDQGKALSLRTTHRRTGAWITRYEKDPTSDSPAGHQDTMLENDATLWRAQQHKNEHLDQYIETARQEAEAQGVHINLEQPKE